MEQEAFFSELRQRGKSEETITLARQVLDDFHRHKSDLPDYLQVVREYTDEFITKYDNALNRLVILFWFHDFIQVKPVATYLLTMLGTVRVLENQKQRMALLCGNAKAEAVFSKAMIPTLGSDLRHYPTMICDYLKSMTSYLPESECRRVLAGNHHDVDVTQFAEDKLLFADELNLQELLLRKHRRLIEELQSFAQSGKLWFEQHITQDVVDYVMAHQEIQTGIVEGDRVIVAKIPYNPDAWLKAANPIRKRYHACHCPFVREAVLTSEAVPSLWCYCSGGFTKLFYDYLFDADLEVELLESVLDGADICRFAIQLPREYTENHFINRQKIDLSSVQLSGRILDIGGGGEGIIGRLFEDKVISIDTRKDELEEARCNTIKIEMDASELKFIDNTFDYVYSFYTFMYMKKDTWTKVFSEALRVLKQGGEMHIRDVYIPQKPLGAQDYFSVPMTIKLNATDEVKTIYGIWWEGRELDMNTLKCLAEEAGFSVMEQENIQDSFFLRLVKTA